MDSSEAVLQRFKSSSDKIAALLRGAPGTEAQTRLEEASMLISRAEQEVAQGSYLLATYDSQTLSASIKQLKEQLYSARVQAAPRKKFAFSKASKNRVETFAEEQPHNEELPAATSALAHDASVSQENATDRGINGARCSTIVKTAEDLVGADYVLSDLRQCTIHLRGRMGALRIQNVQDCLIYAGPVAGATFVNDVQHSCLILISHQLRIHSSSHVTFLLEVQSNPIIEDCRGMRFGAPLPDDPDTAELAKLSSMGDRYDKWMQVQDFGWLKSTASPNWCSLTMQQGKQAVLDCKKCIEEGCQYPNM
ncbi:Tubulin-specific chaperone C [Coccomyxa sp. Obi]|nr:Tubulin-specific chaperone C [Coccomyxa sp. Obi]